MTPPARAEARRRGGRGHYDLSQLTEVVQSGWTGDLFMWRHEFNGQYVVFEAEQPDLHHAITALVATWQRTESDGGGVITYTKGDEQ